MRVCLQQGKTWTLFLAMLLLLVWLDWGRSLQLAGLSETPGPLVPDTRHHCDTTDRQRTAQPDRFIKPHFLQLGLSLCFSLPPSPFPYEENTKKRESNDCTLSETSVSTGPLACWCLMCQLRCYDKFFSDVTYFQTFFLQQYLLLSGNPLACALSFEETGKGMWKCI